MATAAKTTTRRTTTATRRSTTTEAKTAAPSETAAEPVVAEIIPIVEQPELKKKDLIEAVVARSGIKKRDAKPAIEAMLAILGEALADGRELNLQPLGKLKVTRLKKGGNGQIINARVRQPENAENTGDEALASGDE